MIQVDRTINEFEHVKRPFTQSRQHTSNKVFSPAVLRGINFQDTHHLNSLDNIVHTATKGQLTLRKQLDVMKNLLKAITRVQ